MARTVKMVDLKCDYCDLEFKRKYSQHYSEKSFCSPLCYIEYRKKIFKFVVRNYHLIRNTIFRRDGNRCCLCKRDDLRLCIHHIDGSGDGNIWEKSNNNPENLITLCTKCHGKVHKKTTAAQ